MRRVLLFAFGMVCALVFTVMAALAAAGAVILLAATPVCGVVGAIFHLLP